MKTKKAKKPCKVCIPDPSTRKSYTGKGTTVIDVYKCERCGKTITRKPW